MKSVWSSIFCCCVSCSLTPRGSFKRLGKRGEQGRRKLRRKAPRDFLIQFLWAQMNKVINHWCVSLFFYAVTYERVKSTCSKIRKLIKRRKPADLTLDLRRSWSCKRLDILFLLLASEIFFRQQYHAIYATYFASPSYLMSRHKVVHIFILIRTHTFSFRIYVTAIILIFSRY